MTFTYPKLTRWKKNQLLQHAKLVLETQQAMQTPEGESIIHYALENHHQAEHSKHYPPGDRIDHSTGAQYFYHCHRENYVTEEHGHFHCFLRYQQISKHIKPKKLADWDKYINNPMTHLIAIALNRHSEPIRLFAVNRWVSEEIWYDANQTKGFIHRFQMTKKDNPYWQILDQWIVGMLHLFALQIQWVNEQRDCFVTQQMLNDPSQNVFEQKEFEELSSIPINLHEHIQWILNS